MRNKDAMLTKAEFKDISIRINIIFYGNLGLIDIVRFFKIKRQHNVN
jgi:hypothetical protein